MSDDKLNKALKSLPRISASPDFTERVLDRISSANKPGRAIWRPQLAAAAAVVLMFVLPALVWYWPAERNGSDAVRAEIEAVKAEKAAIEAELQSLRRMAKETGPVVYLGGNDDVSLVLDVGALITGDSTGNGSS